MRSYGKHPWRIVATSIALGLGSPVLAEQPVVDPAVAVIKELLAAHQRTPVKQTSATVTHIALAEAQQPAGTVAQPAQQPDPPERPANAESRERAASEQAPPAPQPVVPVQTDAGPTPAPVPLPPVQGSPAPAPSVSEILQELETRQRQDAAEAAQLINEARQALSRDDLNQAMRLAMRASKLAPGDQQVSQLMADIRTRNQENRLATTSYSKAKAHLAAGLTRGQELFANGRFVDGADLLEGVVKAAELFPADARIEIYRDQAKRELAQFHSAVKTGKIILPAPETAEMPAEEPVLVATGAAVPANMTRLLRGSEAAVPPWYAMQKNLLARNMTVAYKSTPIALVLEDISEATGVKFVIDAPVNEARATVNGVLDLRVAEVPAEKILDLACLKGGMEYVIMERAVVVTTPSKALDYVRQLPLALRENWAVGRVLFPSLNPELFAQAPRTLTAEEAAEVEEQLADEEVPAYLTSGQALVDDITSLLR